jgi:hypothetical protein
MKTITIVLKGRAEAEAAEVLAGADNVALVPLEDAAGAAVKTGKINFRKIY